MANRAQESVSSKQQRGGRQGGSPQAASPQGAKSNTSMPATDPTYGIVSVLYHALQGAQTYQQYSNDARQAGDAELEQFFDSCRKEEHARALQAKSLLMDRLEQEEGESDDEEDEEDEEDE
jgi:hypothetical protein